MNTDDETPGRFDELLWWTGLWMLVLSPRRFTDDTGSRGFSCPGLLWLPGLISVVAAWVATFAVVVAGLRREGGPPTHWYAPLAPVVVFVGLWLVGVGQFRLRGATKAQLSTYSSAAFRWMGFPGGVVQWVLVGITAGLVAIAKS